MHHATLESPTLRASHISCTDSGLRLALRLALVRPEARRGTAEGVAIRTLAGWLAEQRPLDDGRLVAPGLVRLVLAEVVEQLEREDGPARTSGLDLAPAIGELRSALGL